MTGRDGARPACGRCGHALPSVSGYCPSCGHLAVAVPADPVKGSPASTAAPDAGRPLWLSPLAGFAAVVLVCCGAVFGVAVGLRDDDALPAAATGEVGEEGLDLETDDGTRVEIPDGAVPEGTEATIETMADPGDEAPLPPWGDLGGPTIVVDVPEPLSVPATLTFPFDRTVFAEDEPLVLTRFDPLLPAWVPVESAVDHERGLITAETADLAGRWRISAGRSWVTAARPVEASVAAPPCAGSATPDWFEGLDVLPGDLEACAGGAFGVLRIAVAGHSTRPFLLEGPDAPEAVNYEGLSRAAGNALAFSVLATGEDGATIYVPPASVTRFNLPAPDAPSTTYVSRTGPELVVADLLYSLAPAIDLTESSLSTVLACSMRAVRTDEVTRLPVTGQVARVADIVRFCATDLGSSPRSEAMSSAIHGWLAVLDHRLYARTALGAASAGFTITASPVLEPIAPAGASADEAIANWAEGQPFVLPVVGPCPDPATGSGSARQICHVLQGEVETGLWYAVGVGTSDPGIEILVAELADGTYAVVDEWRPGASAAEPPWAA